MVRALLIGVLAMSVVAACDRGSGAPTAQPGVAAGKVVEVVGTVTARRGEVVRPLSTADEISGDDVIETAGDGRVVIVLDHNNATWSLGPNKHEKVVESLAWSLAKVDQPTVTPPEATIAAGRHAEKAAATTGTTAMSAAEPARGATQETTTIEKETEDTGAPEADPVPEPKAAPEHGERERRAVPAAAIPARRPASPPPTFKPLAQPRPVDSANQVTSPTTGSPVVVTRSPVVGGGGPGNAGDGKSDPSPKQKKAGSSTKTVERDKDKSASGLADLARQEQVAMNQCLGALPSLIVTLKVDHGVAQFLFASTVSDATRACFAKIATRLKPTTTSAGSMQIKLVRE